jgi:glycosyltransferase involved in cell wall biosynthesis
VEIIVVNDGGEYNTCLLTEGLSHVSIVSYKSNRGRGAARNIGLKLARGKYIALLDDDDYWSDQHLLSLVSLLEHDDALVATYGDSMRVAERRLLNIYVTMGHDFPFRQDFDHDKLMDHNYIPSCSIVIRKSVLDQIGGFDETLQTHEDWDLFRRLAKKGPFERFPQVTSCFSWRFDGTSTSSSYLYGDPQEGFNATRERILQRDKAALNGSGVEVSGVCGSPVGPADGNGSAHDGLPSEGGGAVEPDRADDSGQSPATVVGGSD